MATGAIKRSFMMFSLTTILESKLYVQFHLIQRGTWGIEFKSRQ